MQRFFYDVAVVGGGIIGCATARELLIRNPRLKLAIIEKEKAIAQHQSGHNSGVMHSGIYYTPGSLKSLLCVEGLDLAYEYCTRKDIPFRKCGKLIVAVEEEEIQRLDALFERAQENKVKDIALLDPDGIREIEPNVKGLKAIWSPNTGIVDWARVTESFARECTERGGDIHLDFAVRSFVPHRTKAGESCVLVSNKTTDMVCRHVVTCGGLHSDKLARLTGCSPEPKIVPFRGDYLVLKPEKSRIVSTNVYPVPHPELPFLGVHITPRMDGSVWLGPNAVLAFKREGYSPMDFDVNDAYDFLKYKGLQKLAGKHLLHGLREIYRGINTYAQVQILQKYLPSLQVSDVIR